MRPKVIYGAGSTLDGFDAPPQPHGRKKLEPGFQRWRPGQPSSTRMASGWVYCKVFLDRAAAFDRGPGKSVEVRSDHRTLAGSIESI